jgi:hypothetical protein
LRATLVLATSAERESDWLADPALIGESGHPRRRASRVAGWRSLLKRPPRS